MAKHKYSGKWFFPRVQDSFALGTLASKTLVSTGGLTAVVGKVWCSSAKLAWSMTANVPATGDGPITVGLAHSDYTDAEIEEWIEATTSMSFSDKIAQERAGRKCRIVGTLNTASPTAVLNDGRPIKTKCRWIMEDGQSMNLWAYNEGNSALGAGAVISATGNLNLRL